MFRGTSRAGTEMNLILPIYADGFAAKESARPSTKTLEPLKSEEWRPGGALEPPLKGRLGPVRNIDPI